MGWLWTFVLVCSLCHIVNSVRLCSSSSPRVQDFPSAASVSFLGTLRSSGSVCSFRFTSSKEALEFRLSDVTLSSDFTLKLYDGISESGILLATVTAGMTASAFQTFRSSSAAKAFYVTITGTSITTNTGFSASLIPYGPGLSCSTSTTLQNIYGALEDGSGSGVYDTTVSRSCSFSIVPATAASVFLFLNFADFNPDANSRLLIYDNSIISASTQTLIVSSNADVASIRWPLQSSSFLVVFNSSTPTAISSSLSYAGFEGYYTVGATAPSKLTLQTSGGLLSSSFGGTYTGSQQSSFTIQPIVAGSLVQSITLSFLSFSTQTADMLTVYDGSSTSATVLGVYAGSNFLPPSLTSSGSSLTLVFKASSGVSTSSGFVASFDSQCSACSCAYFNGGIFTRSSPFGLIADGAGSSSSVAKANCTWSVVAANNVPLLLYFNTFYINGSQSYVSVYDGADDKAPFLGTFNGTKIPAPLRTSGGSFFVRFIASSSDSHLTSRFTLRYMNTTTFPLFNTYFQMSPTMSYSLTLPYGFFSNGDKFRGNDAGTTQWLIAPANAESIFLIFPTFLMSRHYVAVYDGSTTASPQLATNLDFAHAPSAYRSSGPTMLVTYQDVGYSSDINGLFFGAYYSQTRGSTCAGSLVLSQTFGFLTDGSGSTNYSNNALCEWTITVPTLTNLYTLIFTSFDLETKDFVSLLQGGQVVASYTGQDIPHNFLLNVTTIVRFTSDDSGTSAGFEANYTAGNIPDPVVSGSGTASGTSSGTASGTGTGSISSTGLSSSSTATASPTASASSTASASLSSTATASISSTTTTTATATTTTTATTITSFSSTATSSASSSLTSTGISSSSTGSTYSPTATGPSATTVSVSGSTSATGTGTSTGTSTGTGTGTSSVTNITSQACLEGYSRTTSQHCAVLLPSVTVSASSQAADTVRTTSGSTTLASYLMDLTALQIPVRTITSLGLKPVAPYYVTFNFSVSVSTPLSSSASNLLKVSVSGLNVNPAVSARPAPWSTYLKSNSFAIASLPLTTATIAVSNSQTLLIQITYLPVYAWVSSSSTSYDGSTISNENVRLMASYEWVDGLNVSVSRASGSPMPDTLSYLLTSSIVVTNDPPVPPPTSTDSSSGLSSVYIGAITAGSACAALCICLIWRRCTHKCARKRAEKQLKAAERLRRLGLPAANQVELGGMVVPMGVLPKLAITPSGRFEVEFQGVAMPAEDEIAGEQREDPSVIVFSHRVLGPYRFVTQREQQRDGPEEEEEGAFSRHVMDSHFSRSALDPRDEALSRSVPVPVEARYRTTFVQRQHSNVSTTSVQSLDSTAELASPFMRRAGSSSALSPMATLRGDWLSVVSTPDAATGSPEASGVSTTASIHSVKHPTLSTDRDDASVVESIEPTSMAEASTLMYLPSVSSVHGGDTSHPQRTGSRRPSLPDHWAPQELSSLSSPAAPFPAIETAASLASLAESSDHSGSMDVPAASHLTEEAISVASVVAAEKLQQQQPPPQQQQQRDEQETWEKFHDPQYGLPYWHHKRSGSSVWEDPSGDDRSSVGVVESAVATDGEHKHESSLPASPVQLFSPSHEVASPPPTAVHDPLEFLPEDIVPIRRKPTASSPPFIASPQAVTVPFFSPFSFKSSAPLQPRHGGAGAGSDVGDSVQAHVQPVTLVRSPSKVSVEESQQISSPPASPPQRSSHVPAMEAETQLQRQLECCRLLGLSEERPTLAKVNSARKHLRQILSLREFDLYYGADDEYTAQLHALGVRSLEGAQQHLLKAEEAADFLVYHLMSDSLLPH